MSEPRPVTSELLLRRKWTLRAHGKQMVFVKRPNESMEHVAMKALLWALYLPEYPNVSVETTVGDRYKPDVVSLDGSGQPRFWGEAGHVGNRKIQSLSHRYRRTHFALAKWSARLDPFVSLVNRALAGQDRRAPFDLLGFPSDSWQRFIRDDGGIEISFDDVEWARLW